MRLRYIVVGSMAGPGIKQFLRHGLDEPFAAFSSKKR